MAYEVNPGHDPELFYHCACLEPGEADKLRADLDAAKARIAELETENEELRHVLTAALCALRSSTGERRE